VPGTRRLIRWAAAVSSVLSVRAAGGVAVDRRRIGSVAPGTLGHVVEVGVHRLSSDPVGSIIWARVV
jgi:hypothetical protein